MSDYCVMEIIKFFFQFENLGRDIKIIFNHILGVELDEVLHVNSGNGKSMKNKTIHYLNQLSSDQKKNFYAVYQHDFKMFQYDSYLENTDLQM